MVSATSLRRRNRVREFLRKLDNGAEERGREELGQVHLRLRRLAWPLVQTLGAAVCGPQHSHPSEWPPPPPDPDAEALIRAALQEAGYGPDAIGSALPRIMRILQAEDVRMEVGRTLSRKEREYVRVQLEIGLSVPEIVAGLKR